MEIVFVLIPVSLVIVIIALWAFVWAVRNDQFEDLDKEAFRILFDKDKKNDKVNMKAEEKDKGEAQTEDKL